MKPYQFEDIVKAARNGGQDLFAGLNPEVRKNVEIDQAKSAEDARAVASAWAEFAGTPGGRKALEVLFDTTLRRTVFFVNLGQDIQSMAVWGAFREGQNALAHEIARQIGLGQRAELKPRDAG